MNKVIIALAVAILVFLCVFVGRLFLDTKQMPREYDQGQSFQSENRAQMLKMFGERGWARKFVSRRKTQVDSMTSNAIAKSFSEFCEAYEDNGVVDLSMFAARIPSDVTNITDKVYSELSGSIYRMVYDDFWHVVRLHEFASVDEFSRYCKKHIYVSRFLANMRLLRQEYGYVLPRVEADVLTVLKRYKEHYDRNGKGEYSQCAMEFIADWIRQIESFDGFTRQYILADVALQLLPCNDADVNCEQLLESVRHDADALIRAGYTPKWLDEEFRLPAEKR